MSEPSEEALKRAERIVSHLASERKWGVHEARDHIATALQELMDERDRVTSQWRNWDAALDEMRERAEKAEADLAELVRLVRRVREWAGSVHLEHVGWKVLYAILAEFEAKP